MGIEEAAGVLRAEQSKRLEGQAIKLVQDYGLVLMMKPQVKQFFRDVADFNGWDNLKQELK